MTRLMLLCALMLLAGCGGPRTAVERAEATTSSQISAQRAALRERVDHADEGWRAQGIDSYELEVRHEQIDTIWAKVTVHDGRIVETSCRVETIDGRASPERAFPSCEMVEQDPLAFTVPGLFRTVREQILKTYNYRGYSLDMIMRLELDLQHQYPRRLRWLQPEPFEWEVTSFKPLE